MPPPTQPNAPGSTQPNAPGSTMSIPLSQTGQIALPSVGGITNSIELANNNAPNGATLSVTVSISAPAGVAGVPASRPTAFEYFSLTSSADVTFKSIPKMTLTLPGAPKNQGTFYAWIYNTGAKTWTDLGTVTVSGSALAFGGSARSITLKHGVPQVIVPFTAAAGATCPTPPPCPPPTPTPGPTPTGELVYVSTTCGGPHSSFMRVFDEAGNPVGVSGNFPNLDAPTGIAFDSANQRLYVTNLGNTTTTVKSTVTVYDRNGHEIAVSGTFPNLNAPIGIAFDPTNRRLYVTNSIGHDVSVYDENGAPVTTSGMFPGANGPLGVVFDPANAQLYIVISGDKIVRVYDPEGNQVATTGTFPNLQAPFDITFDSANQRLYVTDQGFQSGPTVRVYDQEGNQFVSGPFIDITIPTSIAFDSHNRQLYVVDAIGFVLVYDESGNLITTNFPNLQLPSGIVIVP